MIMLCITILPNDKSQTVPAEIGFTIKPTPLNDKVITVVVAPIITTASTDSSFEVSFL